MNCAALSVTLVSSQWSVLGWCLSICTEQTDRWTGFQVGREGRLEGRWLTTSVCCGSVAIVNWLRTGGAQAEAAGNKRQRNGRARSSGRWIPSITLWSSRAGHRGTSESTKTRGLNVCLSGWLAARLVIGRYQCRLGMTMTMTLQIAVNEWKSDALHVRSSRSEWMGMMVLDSWTGGGCSSCVTYKCDSECHCRSANGGMDKSFLWTVSSSFEFVSGCSIRVCLSVIRFRVIDKRSLMDAIPTNWTELNWDAPRWQMFADTDTRGEICNIFIYKFN